MSPLVVVAVIAGAWFVLSALAALWLAQLLELAEDGPGDTAEPPRI